MSEKDEALGLITLNIKPNLIHHTKDNKSVKEIWDTFKNLFGTVNTTQINKLKTKLSNLKMGDFESIEEYIGRFKNLKVDIITSGGKAKTYSEYVSIVLNNLSSAFKSFAIIFYSIPLFVKGYTTPSLRRFLLILSKHQVTLRNMGELPPQDQAHPKATSTSSKHEHE
jgi:hypothetical protein